MLWFVMLGSSKQVGGLAMWMKVSGQTRAAPGSRSLLTPGSQARDTSNFLLPRQYTS